MTRAKSLELVKRYHADRLAPKPPPDPEPKAEESAIKTSKPYKPRKPLNDQYHRMMRDAQKHKRADPVKESERKRTRKEWERKNKDGLATRREFVRDARKRMGLMT